MALPTDVKPAKPKRKDLRRRPAVKDVGRMAHLSEVQIAELRSRLLGCWGQVEIVKHYAPLWDKSESTIRRALTDIFAEWVKTSEGRSTQVTRADAEEKILAFLKHCYDSDDSNLKRAIPQALDKLCRVYGAYTPEKSSLELSGGISIGNMDESAIKARVKELITKHKDSLK